MDTQLSPTGDNSGRADPPRACKPLIDVQQSCDQRMGAFAHNALESPMRRIETALGQPSVAAPTHHIDEEVAEPDWVYVEDLVDELDNQTISWILRQGPHTGLDGRACFARDRLDDLLRMPECPVGSDE